jgi:hypothetical protein
MGLYSLDEPYRLSLWYEHNGAYDLNAGTDASLDITREIIESDNYIFQGYTFPSNIVLQPQQTFSGVLNLQPFSYLLSVTGSSGNDNQFTIRIYDKGAQTDLYFSQFAWFPVVLSNMTDNFNNGAVIKAGDLDMPFGPYFFRSPLIVLPPGQLQVQVTNVAQPYGTIPPASLLNNIQILIGAAVPKTTVSLNRRTVTTPIDQTGVRTLQNVASMVLD